MFNVSITVYKIDHVHRRLTPECSDANTCRAAKTQDKCKIINRHTHTHTHTHTPPSVLPSLPPPPESRWKWLLMWKICQPFRPIHFFVEPVPILSAKVKGSDYEGRGPGDLSNISETCGRQDTQFCVFESPRGELSQIASLNRA